MLNQIVLVGRVYQMPNLVKTANGSVIASLLLEVDRCFKNPDGIVEKDIFNIQLWRGIAETCCDVLEIGSLIGVKGRIQAHNYEKQDLQYYNAEIIAEKVSFLDVRRGK